MTALPPCFFYFGLSADQKIQNNVYNVKNISFSYWDASKHVIMRVIFRGAVSQMEDLKSLFHQPSECIQHFIDF